MTMNKLILSAAFAISSLAVSAQNIQKGDYGYLYCHMSDHGEFTAYALSRDGYNYEDIIGGRAVIDPKEHARIEGGQRDAFITRSWDGKGFVMVTTDMCVAKSRKWDNYGIDLLKSDDLINWTSVTFDYRKGTSIFMNPDLKLYNTIVAIEGGAGVLKSGMNCEAEVVIEQYEKAMYLPVQCVVREDGKPVVYLKTATGTKKHEVEIGLDNNRMVRIVSGLKVGDEVMLTPPMNTSVALRASEEMIDAEQNGVFKHR